jgi:hypothetical protein
MYHPHTIREEGQRVDEEKNQLGADITIAQQYFERPSIRHTQ